MSLRTSFLRLWRLRLERDQWAVMTPLFACVVSCGGVDGKAIFYGKYRWYGLRFAWWPVALHIPAGVVPFRFEDGTLSVSEYKPIPYSQIITAKDGE